jgi:hypothetical protein
MPGTRPLTEVFRLMCDRFPGLMAVTMAVCAAQRSRRMPKASGAWNVG